MPLFIFLFCVAAALLDDIFERKPNAIGIAVIAHHRDVPDNIAYSPERENGLLPLEGIELGTLQLKRSLDSLNIAVIRLDNPTRLLLLALLEALTSRNAPPSYKYFFFYTTGHGARSIFYTKDASVSYMEVYTPFKNGIDTFKQRYFFFDCCKAFRIDPPARNVSVTSFGSGMRLNDFPENHIGPKDYIVYATTTGDAAYGPGQGVSFMIAEMTKLLFTDRSIQGIASQVKGNLADRQVATHHIGTAHSVNLIREKAKGDLYSNS